VSAFPGKSRPTEDGPLPHAWKASNSCRGDDLGRCGFAEPKGGRADFRAFPVLGKRCGIRRRPRFTTRFPSRKIRGSTLVLSEDLTRLSRLPWGRVCRLIGSALFRSVGVLRHPLRRNRLTQERLEKISLTARKLGRQNFSRVDACCGTNSPRGNRRRYEDAFCPYDDSCTTCPGLM
jgi:hypothetical protein